jgi:hypothetical protein
MQWMVLIIPTPLGVLGVLALVGVLVMLWIRGRHVQHPCCVCGAVRGYEVCYLDAEDRPVSEYFCSACLGALLCPQGERLP